MTAREIEEALSTGLVSMEDDLCCSCKYNKCIPSTMSEPEDFECEVNGSVDEIDFKLGEKQVVMYWCKEGVTHGR